MATIQWGDIATWVASVGTVTAVGLALAEAGRQRRREARQALREQAESISAWVTGRRRAPLSASQFIETGLDAHLANSSAQLVYEVVIFEVLIQGAGPRTGEEWMALEPEARRAAYKVLGALQPGHSGIEMPYIPPPPQGRYGLEIAFTDKSGNHWIRRTSGSLERVATNAIDHYGIARPIDDYTSALTIVS